MTVTRSHALPGKTVSAPVTAVTKPCALNLSGGSVASLRHILLVFVDGIGVPPGNLSESIYRDCPQLCRLLQEHCVPLDAQLGVPGTPQSATGQTAILTGRNAAAEAGGHIEGFPNAHLRDIIEEGNLFSAIVDRGMRCTFANAYVLAPGGHLPLGLRSVTTVATLSALGSTRTREDLLAGQAVYHDITRETLAERGITGIPCIVEKAAAQHLVSIFRTVDFCLFEFFLTDHVGHRGDVAEKQRILGLLDSFLGSVLEQLDPRHELLLVVSDHGNIEDTTRRGHSSNPVPWIACGCGAGCAQREMVDLTDVTPRILQLLDSGGGRRNESPHRGVTKVGG